MILLFLWASTNQSVKYMQWIQQFFRKKILADLRMFRQIRSLLPTRNVGYIRNPARKQKRLRDKILSESMKISPMTPMEKSRSDFKSKRNRFGVTIETNKVDHRQFGVDDRWKNLSKSDRKNPYKVSFKTTNFFNLTLTLSYIYRD